MKRFFLWLMLGMPAAAPAAVPLADADAPVILVFGDSLSAGFGLAHADQGWVGMLRSKLKGEAYGYQVVNASVSGETTAGGLARLPRALILHHPRVVIIELGGNDGLRALPVDQMRANLARMMEAATSAGAKVLLLGMRIPPNYGPEYAEQFSSSFAVAAREKRVPFVPFLLADIALDTKLMQADGIHPNELGQFKLLDNVWPALKPLLAH